MYDQLLRKFTKECYLLTSLKVKKDEKGWWRLEGNLESLMIVLYRLFLDGKVKRCLESKYALENKESTPSALYLKEAEKNQYEIIFLVNDEHQPRLV